MILLLLFLLLLISLLLLYQQYMYSCTVKHTASTHTHTYEEEASKEKERRKKRNSHNTQGLLALQVYGSSAIGEEAVLKKCRPHRKSKFWLGSPIGEGPREAQAEKKGGVAHKK